MALRRASTSLGVRAHLEGGDGDAAGVGGLARAECDALLDQVVGRLAGGGHVGALAHHLAATGDELLGVLEEQLVLRGAGKRDVARFGPHAAALVVLAAGMRLGVL